MNLYKNDTFMPSNGKKGFAVRYQSLEVISTESVNSFLSSVRDSLYGISRLLDNSTEKFFKEIDSRRFETLTKCKELKFVNIKHSLVTVPEQFSGYYLPYLKDVNSVSDILITRIDNLTTNLKFNLANFINENIDKTTTELYGQIEFNNATKELIKDKKLIASYFKNNQNKVKSQIGDVLHNLGEVDNLFNELDKLKIVYTNEVVSNMEAKVRSVTSLVDALIDVNIKTNVLNRSSELKKELILAIDVTAESVEYYNAMFANVIFFCKAFSDLQTSLLGSK